MDESRKSDDTIDFSLTLGGLIYRFYLWTGLAKNPLLLVKRRTLILCLFAWLPLFILTIISGQAFSGVKVPFIYDIDVHVRFLISLALLILAEVYVHDRLQELVRQFLRCNLIAPADRKRFYSMIASVKRLTNSIVVEILLIIFVYTIGAWISSKSIPLGVSIWYVSKINDVAKLTPAGYWYAYVSVPLFQFILLRWYYRLAIWYRFLWQVSRLPLQLNSLHPDRAGGIGFLANSVYVFEPLLIAHSVLLAGMIFNRIWNAGATLGQFQGEISSILIALILLPLIPLMFFMAILVKTRRIGTLSYDVVANRYVNKFRQKWIGTEAKNSETLLGNSDFQSLADLANSFAVSAKMRVTPFGKEIILSVIVITALPLLPLLFTIMPLERIITQFINMIF